MALYLELNLEKTFVAVRTMPDHSRYGDAWHSNSRFSRQIGALKKGTRRARASTEPVRKEEVMCHANRAASAAPDATRRCNSRIFLSQGTASEASTGGRLSICPYRPDARRSLRNYC